jgi:3-oxoacyl-[acyl-carrier protein] reductase
MSQVSRPVALVTGVGRSAGIGAAIARALGVDGWDVVTSHWRPYDDIQKWSSSPGEIDDLHAELSALGARSTVIEADLSDPEVPSRLVASALEQLGPLTALVMSHCAGFDTGLHETTIGEFDSAMAVNARASWLLIRAFAEQFDGPAGRGRIVALTSDATVGNLAYGASKGALDRIVIASASELAPLGVTANVINPGPTDTGWMSPAVQEELSARTPLCRVGLPRDCARLVAFLLSEDGGWITGQLLHSDGGFSANST